MRLSEAIRLGALTGPQYHAGFFGPDDSSCALGAAAIAVGLKTHLLLFSLNVAPLTEKFPILFYSFISDYCDCEKISTCEPPLHDHIVHLNDTHKWTREQIADWVAVIENDQPLEQSSAPINEHTNISTKEEVCV
jgi:hypothetical protein